MFVAVSVPLMIASQVAALLSMSRSSTQKLELCLHCASVYSAAKQLTLVRLTLHVHFQFTFV